MSRKRKKSISFCLISLSSGLIFSAFDKFNKDPAWKKTEKTACLTRLELMDSRAGVFYSAREVHDGEHGSSRFSFRIALKYTDYKRVAARFRENGSVSISVTFPRKKKLGNPAAYGLHDLAAVSDTALMGLWRR